MSLGATLTHKVGPLPMGVWLLLGGGGLFIANKSRQSAAATAAAAPAFDPSATVGSYDAAPEVTSPIINVFPAAAPVSTVVPTPVKAPTPATKITPTPRVATPPKTSPRIVPAKAKPVAQIITHTVVEGDTLWDLAGHFLGNPLLWTRIYAQNAATIDATAHAHGKPGGGHWIYPGETLRFSK